MLRHFFALLLLFTGAVCHAAYVQDRDLISLHYDHAPDRDDGHATVAALAVVRTLGIQPHVVSGAYGQRNRNQYQPAAEPVMQETWGSDWLNAHANWQASVNATYTRWLATLSNGGDIWVAEGGQADFTADVVRLINSNNRSINTRARIHVVQHSTWNEEQANQSDLNYTRNNTNYVKIADGNGSNATADLNQKSASFVTTARASQYAAAWNAAFRYLNPNNKLDFSDTVELLHILEIGKDRIATVNDFGAEFLTQNSIPQPSSPTAWSDSYSVEGQCYCDTNFDHGLTSVTVNTPAGNKRVPEICADITAKLGVGSFNNRVYYNTIQCGHPPANNAADESSCPGIPRATNNYTGYRCQQTGATWNLDKVYSQTPEPTEPAAPTEQPVPEEAPPAVFPTCSSDAIDSDGDGYAWEKNQSCVISTDQPTTSPEPTIEQPTSPPDLIVDFPTCRLAATDEDGDGYGWENNQTCTISSTTTGIPDEPNLLDFFPACSAFTNDTDGDGYAWENNQTCVVTSTTSAPPSAVLPDTTAPPAEPNLLDLFPICINSTDPDGDGYSWENGQSCIVVGNPTTTAQPGTPSQPNLLDYFPSCSASLTDSDGDIYGWENNQTCVFSNNLSSIPAPVTPENLADYFPACSSSATDPDGDGYSWENNQTCLITNPGANVTAPGAPASDSQPASVSLLQFPSCSNSATDLDGDGYAWENNQTCAISPDGTPVSLAVFPICSDAAIDENNDGYAWENNQSCTVISD